MDDFEAHGTQTAWRARAGRPWQRQRAVGCRQRGRAGRGGRQPAGLGGRAVGCGRRRGRRRRRATRRARLQVRGAPATRRWAGLPRDHCRYTCEAEQPPQGVGSVRAALLSAAALPLGRCKLWWAFLVCATVGRACSCWCCSECKRAVGAARESARPLLLPAVPTACTSAGHAAPRNHASAPAARCAAPPLRRSPSPRPARRRTARSGPRRSSARWTPSAACAGRAWAPGWTQSWPRLAARPRRRAWHQSLRRRQTLAASSAARARPPTRPARRRWPRCARAWPAWRPPARWSPARARSASGSGCRRAHARSGCACA